MTSSDLSPEKKLLIERAEAAFEEARRRGVAPASPYFLEKCSSESGSAPGGGDDSDANSATRGTPVRNLLARLFLRRSVSPDKTR